MKWKYHILSYAFIILIIVLAFTAGYFTYARLNGSTSDLNILAQARSVLENHALYELPSSSKLEYGMIRGMLQEYDDPYTRFVEPNQHEIEGNSLEGSFAGIGTALDHDSEGYLILHPFPNSPASKVGILDGDRLLIVDDLIITNETAIDEIVATLRGIIGETVDLTISRAPSYDPIAFNIIRESILLPSVTWYLAPNQAQVGVIKVNIIASSTKNEIQNAVEDLQHKGAQFFALDLRGNRGGLVDAGISIAELFLTDGEVLEEQYRGQDIKTHRVTQAGPLIDIPLVILVDENTASAAEIIAGALQVNERATIIGHATFGKDTVQLVFDLEDSASIHVTAAKWWIPGLGTSIGENGIQPDIVVASGQNPDPVLEAATLFLTREP